MSKAAKEYLMNQMNSPEFVSEQDEVMESFKVIGNIMQSYADEQNKARINLSKLVEPIKLNQQDNE